MPTHVYKLKSGKRVPGVTTIIGHSTDKGGLMQWAFQQGVAGKPSLYEDRDVAADIGTHTHALVQWHLEGESSERPAPPLTMTVPMIARAETAYTQMLRWEQQTGYHITSWEEPLVSEKYEFGGTPDAVFQYLHWLRMGDWKTGKDIYPEALLQACAYILLNDENFPEAPITGGIDIVRFSKDAEVRAHKVCDDRKLIALAQRNFLIRRELYDSDKEIGRLF